MAVVTFSDVPLANTGKFFINDISLSQLYILWFILFLGFKMNNKNI